MPLTIGMKLKTILCATAGLFFAMSNVWAEDDTPMSEEMSDVSSSLKKLRKIDKDDWVGMANATRAAHVSLLKGMAFTAMMVKDMKDGPEKVKSLADSRRLLGLSYAALCELEIAFLEKDQKKVDAAMTKVKSIKKEGHKKYTDD